MPPSVMPRLPFSVAQLYAAHDDSGKGKRARGAADATERAKRVVMEAVRLWRDEKLAVESTLGKPQVAAMAEFRRLGDVYLHERMLARVYNHSELHVPLQIQVTQPQNLASQGKRPMESSAVGP